MSISSARPEWPSNVTDAQGWQRTSPFAALFFFGRLVKALTQNALQTFAPMAALLFAYEGEMMSKLSFIAVTFAIGIVTASVLQYWFFRYRIADDAVLIRQGVFHKKQLDIKFRRIQGVNTEQNIVYRRLGLVTVSFDTAGSSGREGSLPAIRTELVQQLQRKIAATETDVAPKEGVPAQDQGGPLLRLGWRDMLRIGLSDRRALLVVALMGPAFEQLSSQSKRIIEGYALSATSTLGDLGVATGASIVVALVLTALIVLALASVAAAFLRYHNFELYEHGGRLQTVGGLLTRHTSSMDASKIQVLQLKQGTLLRLFGRFNAVFRQATSSGKQGASKSIRLPIVQPELVPSLSRLAFAPELAGLDLRPLSARFQRISTHYMRPRILFFGLLLPSVFIALTWSHQRALSLLILLSLPLVALCVFLTWRRYGVQLSDDGMALRSGFIGFRLDVFLYRKVQRVTVSQSWLQRRKGLGSMRVYLASGSLSLRYVDYELACRLRDHILFKIESSQRSWH